MRASTDQEGMEKGKSAREEDTGVPTLNNWGDDGACVETGERE